ncbi:hypothetical protein SAMD00079811_79110 (plasmid) [Scytonema sp. HK-05]|uniref:hypothetical protein n=1 Tax=Scytonema sp. HK-05 TaxID=1137095 RepID=UPI000B2B964D|nr:hypothetical protein [Scytonema sp. HK-05]BAY50282.1 hypothetical protein SAMD00079811_79110 [Scytonema sp. HK-05]
MIIPDNDTSTGSLEFRDAPPELCTRTRKLNNAAKLVLRTNGFKQYRHLSWCNPIPIVMVPYRSQSLEVPTNLAFTLNLVSG